jgi:hypothetical protein
VKGQLLDESIRQRLVVRLSLLRRGRLTLAVWRLHRRCIVRLNDGRRLDDRQILRPHESASASLYAATQAFGLAVHGYPTGHVWFFNPFAWQFLFIIGAACGFRSLAGHGVVPRGHPPR